MVVGFAWHCQESCHTERHTYSRGYCTTAAGSWLLYATLNQIFHLESTSPLQSSIHTHPTRTVRPAVANSIRALQRLSDTRSGARGTQDGGDSRLQSASLAFRWAVFNERLQEARSHSKFKYLKAFCRLHEASAQIPPQDGFLFS